MAGSSEGSDKGGCLYVAATPIGNLGDMSDRLKAVFQECDLVACEDTRVSKFLLDQLNIQKPMISYREENEHKQTPFLLDKIKAGEKIVLVSDAGTPALSDPGFRVIRECRREGLTVIPIPGPSAFLSALCASGLPTNAFLFVGFLQPKTAARKRFFQEYKTFPHTVILYESSHRIDKCLADLLEELGPERTICVAREITKRHETFLVGKASEVVEAFNARSKKGEFVVLFAPETYTL